MSFRPTPPPGFLHLILFGYEDRSHFYLEIPIAIVRLLCLKPLNYLRFLGWCVLGAEGTLFDGAGNEIPLVGDFIDQGIYEYRVASDNPLAHVIDLAVIKQRTKIETETTRTREDFHSKVCERDGYCVWSGVGGIGMHIIPYAWGDEACS